jgi:hypothetical protein
MAYIEVYGENYSGLAGTVNAYDGGSLGGYWFCTFVVKTIYTMPVVTPTMPILLHHSTPWDPRF